ncbi:ABC transporter permease [Flavivirga sp. 57AJ16]|uniref:ABC transporter permease n=1 Tax=Flavivirga sp. 57AJ16 TaxID=3025307 RepID=UPI002365CC30|nr:ABC transporter permease [Flavivirga sp. 57AJ16]MDD7888058.1 ABC transporter permease [Flavivirga sp. 57AJ16]
MIKNYFKIAWRNFKKDKSFTFINLLGLATGFAITLLIVQYVRFEFSYENTHVNADRLVRLTTDYMDGETVAEQDCETNPPLGPLVTTELPEVENFTRVYPLGEPTVNISIENEHFILDKLFAVDNAFFDMFTCPLLYGVKKDIFKQPNQAVLTESTALKYFGKKDVVGEMLEIPLSQGLVLLNIVGVVADSPPNTHLKFNMLISYPTMLSDKALQGEYGEEEDNWGGNNTLTYILLAPNVNYDDFTTSFKEFNKRLKEEKGFKKARFIGQKIGKIHLYSHKTFETEPNGKASSVFFLLGVAFLVIISAFVNYINLATSKALDRAKEVGIRKVVGSTRTQLRIQFLIESLLINVAAGIFAITLILVSKTKFIEVAGLPADFSIFGAVFFWIILGAFILLGVLFSGLYPALVLSSFKPSSVLKGKFTHSTQGVLFRKSLVVFQFSMTIILLIQIFTINKQLEFLQNIDLGVNTNQTVVVSAPTQNTERKNYSVFKQELLANASVKSVALSGSVPGQMASQMSTTTGINLSEIIEDHNYNFYLTTIDANYIPVMGMTLIEGNNFDETSHPDKREVIVNEEAIRLWGIPETKEAIGRKLKFWGSEWTIKGVLKNYHQESAKSAHIPIIHRYFDQFQGFASIKFNNTDPKEQIAQIEAVYKSVFPTAPFSYFFMDNEYDKQYKADKQFQDVFSVLTGFAILIACLGLFGLASFTVLKRKKEIGIRKVIGASILNILVLLSKNFIKMVFLAMLIGIPITYLIATKWLENFAFRIELNWWLFVLPIVLIMGLVVFSISIKTINAAIVNPVQSLKDE